MEQVVLFHGCQYLVPIWCNERGGEWRFGCCIPEGERCPKTQRRRRASKDCFTEEYPVAYPGEYDAQERTG